MEVLMVAGLMGVLMVILVGVSTTSINRNREAERRTVATRLAQEGAEWLRAERDRVGWLQLYSKLGSVQKEWCIDKFQDQLDDLSTGSCSSVKDKGGTKIPGDFTRTLISGLDASGEFYRVVFRVDWGSNQQTPVELETSIYKKDD